MLAYYTVTFPTAGKKKFGILYEDCWGKQQMVSPTSLFGNRSVYFDILFDDTTSLVLYPLYKLEVTKHQLMEKTSEEEKILFYCLHE